MVKLKSGALLSVLAAVFAAGPTSVAMIDTPDIEIKKVSVEYGHERPFSFYYPYRYKYYYPRRHYSGNTPSCYWKYVNGTYVYYCG